MNKSRRNLYRILYVQPEAPVEVIKASYRTLMGPLGFHPDRGGQHEIAARMNEAYAVLTDPVRRSGYDATLQHDRLRGRDGAGSAPAAASAAAPDPGAWQQLGQCPFCRHALPAPLRRNSRCTRCDAPLTPPPGHAASAREMFGRRSGSRFSKDQLVAVVPGWRARALRAVLRDLSASGGRLTTREPVAVTLVLRLTNSEIDAVAQVISCRRTADQFSVHLRLLTAWLDRPAGVFVDARA